VKKYYLLFCLFFTLFNLQAQQNILSGRVVDSLSNQGIPYASISILDAQQKVLDGMISDSVGKFEFNKLKQGNYQLQIKSIGYKQYASKINMTRNGRMDLGEILLTPAVNQIGQISISAGQTPQKHSADRQTYQASQYKNAVGGTALDIVKNLPAVALDGQGNLSVRGNAGLMVLINGKPSLVDPTSILNQIAANDVSEVEFISSPSAQFDPDGKAGIINIKTKKNITSGFSWIMNLQGGLPSIDDYDNVKKQQRYGADIAFQFKQEKLELNGSANYLRNDNAGFRDGDVNTIIGDRQTSFPSKGERSFDKYNYGLRLNGSYEFNAQNNISIGLLASKKYQDRIADIHYTNRTVKPSTGELLGTSNYFNPNLQNKQGEFYLVDFTYQFKVNPQHAFTLGAIYEHANIHGSTKNANIENGMDTVQYTDNRYTNPLNGLRLQFNHQWKMKAGELLSGYQLRSDKQRGNFEYWESSSGNNNLQLIPEFTGKLKATNLVHAFYSQFDRKLEKTQYSLGLRYEYYQRDVLLLDRNEEFPYSIHQLYPSFNLMHDLGNNLSWKIAAARRVQRNNNFELNPIPEREHSETLEQGDPELLPEFITNAETGLVKKLKNGTVFLNAYFQHSKNPIQRVNSVYADTILHRVFTNADYSKRFGAELGANGKVFPWLTLNLGFNAYHYSISGKVLDYEDTKTNSDWVYNINSGLQASLGKNWSTGLQVNYLSERPTVQGVDSRFLTPHFNLSKSFLKGAMTAQLQWQNIELGDWGVNEQRISTWDKDFYTTTNYIYEKNILLLNLNINLQRLNHLIKLPKSEFGEKEF